MAKKDEKDNQGEAEAPKSKMMLIIIIVAVVALLVGGGVAAFLLMGEEAPVEDAEPAVKPAIYHELKPPFVVNYQWQGRQRYAQISISIMTRDPTSIAALEKHMPLVKNNLLEAFGSQNFDGLRTPEGKEALRQQALETLQQIVLDETGNAGIEQVLFTNFVMQ